MPFFYPTGYTVMESKTNIIVDHELVHVCQAGNSGGMEKLGLKQVLERLQDDDITVNILATDRSPQVNVIKCFKKGYIHKIK